MPTLPFTFPYAGRTFSVIIEGRGGEPDDVFVRIVGIRGLHHFGLAEAGEPASRLRERVCRWYDDVYGGPAERRTAQGEPA